jgi:hypothetical protein
VASDALTAAVAEIQTCTECIINCSSSFIKVTHNKNKYYFIAKSRAFVHMVHLGRTLKVESTIFPCAFLCSKESHISKNLVTQFIKDVQRYKFYSRSGNEFMSIFLPNLSRFRVMDAE